MNHQLWLNFYGEIVLLESEWAEIIEMIEKDFSVFKTHSCPDHSLFIQLIKSEPDYSLVPQTSSKMQTLNSITYQVGDIRYNDYYGKLLSIFDYKNEHATIFSTNEQRTHEIIYLLILSRIGKKLDLRGMHKLHAFAVSYKDTALVCMMPMKGGKSTLLLEMLKYPDVKMISDDIPIVNRKGEVLPFPIKIGIDGPTSELEIKNSEKNVYRIYREQFGAKTFISLQGIPDKVEILGHHFEKVILVEAFRFNSQQSSLQRESRLNIFKGLFKHGVIGVGLPMVIEYFWEFGILDFFKKTLIFFSRLVSFLSLLFRSRCFRLDLGRDSSEAAKLLFSEMIKKN